MFRGLLLLFLLTAGLVCPAQKLAENAGYSDLATGVTFPAKLASFRKTMVRINSNPVIGTRIQYLSSEGRCLATVFIYALTENPVPITDGEFREHCRTIRETILAQAKQTGEPAKPDVLQVTEVESLGRSCFTKGSAAVLREKFLAHSDKEETYHTEVAVLRLGDRIVKLRIAAPSALTEENLNAEKFILAFCRLFFPREELVFKPCAGPAPAADPKK